MTKQSKAGNPQKSRGKTTATKAARKPVAKSSKSEAKASPSQKSKENKKGDGHQIRRPSQREKAEPTTIRTVQAEIVDPSDAESSDSFASDLRSEIEQIAAQGETFSDDLAPETTEPEGDAESELVPLEAKKSRTIESSTSKALAPSDPVALYLAEIRKYPLLTREQEHELATRYRETGDPRAAEMLVTSNLRFVVKIAAEYSRFGAKLIDLIQEGNVGLMHAVREFNPYKGTRLITYAVWWIRGYIQEYLMRQYSMVRIGTTQNQRKLFYKLQKEREALAQLGQEPTNALLAGRLGVTEEEVETMSQRLASRDISLNQPLNGENSTASLLDMEADSSPAIDDSLGLSEELTLLRENIEKIRSQLNEKEKFILEKRLLADEPLTLQEIGDHYGTTREAVRQLENRLIGKIRAALTVSLGGTSSRMTSDDPKDS